MTTRHIPFAYIHSFDGVSGVSSTTKPLRARLKTPRSAQILTLVNGVALSANGTTSSPARYPIEQQMDILIHASTGNAVDDALGAWAQRLGKMATLSVTTPDARVYTTTAMLDQIEIVDDGNMSGVGMSWCVVTLTFQQMVAWSN